MKGVLAAALAGALGACSVAKPHPENSIVFGNIVVVEGDEPVNGLPRPERRGRFGGEHVFLKMTSAGVLPIDQRNVTYAIDKAGFSASEYDEVVLKLGAATARWQSACISCGIRFEHQVDLDEKRPEPSRSLYMVVRRVRTRGEFFALAFFPGADVSDHYLNIDGSFFTQKWYDRTGLLRHEIGHVLGYRHEDAGGTPKCQREAGGWKDLTPYDSLSVMHRLCYSGPGIRSLELSDVDIEGHRIAYAPNAN